MQHKVKAQGVRRKDVDMEKLALAYYLIARAILEDRRATTEPDKAVEASAPDDQKAA